MEPPMGGVWYCSIQLNGTELQYQIQPVAKGGAISLEKKNIIQPL